MVFKKLKRSGKEVAGSAPAALNEMDQAGGVKQLDGRLGLDCYRDFYTLKNYWKSVARKHEHAGCVFLYRYLKANPEYQDRYPRLKNLHIDSAQCSEKGFETTAAEYLNVFNEVITAVESNPSDASNACRHLKTVGKEHRTKVPGMKFDDFQQFEEPFLYMISDVLDDRFNEKAENLFRKFFQFCLKYMLEGFNANS